MYDIKTIANALQITFLTWSDVCEKATDSACTNRTCPFAPLCNDDCIPKDMDGIGLAYDVMQGIRRMDYAE